MTNRILTDISETDLSDREARRALEHGVAPQDDYRKLAQQVRQTARAQLMALRKARGMQLAAPEIFGSDMRDIGSLAGQARRQRRVARQADLRRQAQDARLQFSLDMGLIELWGEAGEHVQNRAPVPGDDDSVESSGPQQPLAASVLERDAPSPDGFFGSPAPDFNLERGLAAAGFIGPFWHGVTADGHPATVPRVETLALAVAAQSGEQPASCLAENPASVGAGSASLSDRAGALTLSAGMRVTKPDRRETEGHDAVEDFPPEAEGQGGVNAELRLKLAEAAVARSMTQALHRAVDAAIEPVPKGLTEPDRSLSSLPGAGPGLIWMLQKCGISSLEEMAEADTAQLVPRLGLVGKIANVQGWKRYAQRQVASAH